VEITLPHKFTAREYQRPVKKHIESGGLRAVCVWHRRSGKDKSGLNILVPKMVERVGVYYYFFPTFAEGKRILWDGIDRDGMRYLDHFPRNLIDGRPNETEMKIKLKNGSLFQIIGTDRYDRVRGTNPVGTIWSEYSFQNPLVWDIVRPILRENKGWALFLYTPNGKNHGYDLFEMALRNDNWFCEKLTILDTKKPDGSPVITTEDVEEDIREGMDKDRAEQEYYCSFEGSVQGSYYSQQLKEAEERIVNVPWISQIKVDTWWDLGIGDSTAIWFVQVIDKEIHLIDYYETQGEGLEHYAKILQDKKYIYDRHIAPFDIKVKELTTGKTRLEVAKSLGIDFSIAPQLSVDDGIQAVRSLLNQCWFDKVKCKRGLDALKNYHKEYDEIRKDFKRKPEHDWSSHGADAFRYGAISFRRKIKKGQIPSETKSEDFDPYNK
jgi:hypothetical protein